MRIFGSDRISGLMQKLGMEEGVPIEHGMVTLRFDGARKVVQGMTTPEEVMPMTAESGD